MRRFTIRFRGWQDDRGNKTPRWCQDSELAANISAWVQLHPDANEENFARFCLDDLIDNLYQFQKLLLQTGVLGNTRLEFNLLVLLLPNFLKKLVLNSLAARHLSALLEKIGYEKSEEIHNNLKYHQNNSVKLPPEDSFDQIFQYAWLEAANPLNFFINFKEQEASLIGYAGSKMKGKMKDQIFGKKYLSTTYTGYGLLRKLGEGKRKRKKVLELQGYQKPRLSNLLLTWECFYQICTPNRQGKIDPTMEHWQAIARQYNQLQKEPNSSVNWQTIKDWIDGCCIPATKSYLAPQSIAIDIKNPETGEGIDIADPSPSPVESFEQEETNEIVRQFTTEFNLSHFIETLKYEDKKLLLLRYGFELRQVDVAEEFNWYKQDKSDNTRKPDNSKVTRAEDKIFRSLAKTILNWMITSQIPRREEAVVIDSDWLKNMNIKSSCNILMKKHFSRLVKLFKEETTNALKQQLPELEVNNQLTDRQQFLNNYVVNQIQTSFNITLQADGSVATKISSLLEDFLEMPQH